jgi:hypothetical protein
LFEIKRMEVQMNRIKKAVALSVLFGAGMSLGATRVFAAFGVDVSSATSASATISAVSTLAVTVKNRSDNSLQSSVGFGTIDGTVNLVAPQYLEVAYQDNAASWGVNIWTDFARTATTPDSNLGGLHLNFTDDAGVPMGWQAVDASTSAPTAAPADFTDANWTFIKSRKDADFAAQQDQYMKVLSGVGPNQALIASGPGAGTAVTSPAVVYMSGFFGSKPSPAGTYSATLGCDLFHE